MSNQLDSGCAIICRTSEVTAGKAQGSLKKKKDRGRGSSSLRGIREFMDSDKSDESDVFWCVSISETYRGLPNKIKRVYSHKFYSGKTKYNQRKTLGASLHNKGF